MYTYHNFRTKKSLKEAVARLLELEAEDGNDPLHPYYNEWRDLARKLVAFQPGPFGNGFDQHDGPATIEGPQYPAAHTWYAQVELRETLLNPGEVSPVVRPVLKGVIVKVE